MRLGRASAVVAGLSVLLAVGAVGIVPVAAQSPSPAEDGSAVAQDAIDQLIELASYRLEQTTTIEGSPVASTDLTVTRIQGDEPAMHVETAYDGEVGQEVVVIGDKGWFSSLGGPMRDMAKEGMPIPDPLQPTDAELRMLQVAIEEGFSLAKVGVEDIDGEAATHYRGSTLAPLASPVDGYYRRTLQGTIDLWVATNGGYLVQSVVDVLDNQRGLTPGPDTFRVTESAHIAAVGDPSNTVTKPPKATPVPEPSGVADPAAAQLITDALARLAALDSWHGTFEVQSQGVGQVLEMTAVNGPPQAANVRLNEDGELFLEYRIIGDQTWWRTDAADPWALATVDDGPTCPDDPCTFADAVATVTGFVTDAGSYRNVGDETLDGVAAHHLRSEAGTTLGDLGRVPAVIDVWVAADDGRLLRQTIDGQALAATLTIDHVDDPANALAEPSPIASPAP